MRRRFIVPFFTLVGILLTLPLSHADTKVLTAEATYTMGDGESPSFAEAQVLQRAKQIALEQAGTYVQTYTKIHNYDLTAEEIQTIAGGVLEVQVLEKTRTLVGDGLRFYIKIKATVTTDKMEELARRIKGKNIAEDYKKLQDEYARLSKELDSWKGLVAKTPSGPEREAALDQIREREKAFARVQKNEATLFQRLVSGQALIVEAHDDRAVIDKLIDSIKKDGHVIEIGKVAAFPAEGLEDHLTVTVPITLKPSAVLRSMLSQVVRSLGGDEVSAIRPGRLTDFVTVTYWLEGNSIENSRLTVKTVEFGKGLSIPLDNSYRGSRSEIIHSYYTIGTPGTEVSLSRTRPLADYFRRRVQDLVFVVQLSSDSRSSDPRRFAPINCRAPFIVSRLIAAEENKGDHGAKFDIPAKGTENTIMLLLFAAAKFSVEFDLLSEMARRVDRVAAWWVVEPDAPKEVCRTILGN